MIYRQPTNSSSYFSSFSCGFQYWVCLEQEIRVHTDAALISRTICLLFGGSFSMIFSLFVGFLFDCEMRFRYGKTIVDLMIFSLFNLSKRSRNTIDPRMLTRYCSSFGMTFSFANLSPKLEFLQHLIIFINISSICQG